MNTVALKIEKDYKANIAPKDYSKAMLAYYNYLTGEAYKPAKIYKDFFQKEIVEALILSGASTTDIKNAFGVPEETIEEYKELFFDVTKLETHLDKLSYVTNYPDRFGKELKLRAINLGPDFIFFKYANIVPQTPVQRDLIKRMFLSSAYRAMESNYTSMTSEVSKSAIEYAKLMLKAYDSIEKLMKEDTPIEMSSVKVLLTRDSELARIFEEIPSEDIV